jgi:methionyl-tRNA formyltransferase
MRIAFAGTPEFARCALTSLAEAGQEVVLVLTQPDRKRGRGMQLTPSPVKAEALRLRLPVFQPQTLRDESALASVKAAAPEILIVAAYGLILPQAALEIARLGAVNIHASLLPRWRGAAPIQRAILAGDRETGISIMQMDAGLDTGAVIAKTGVPILPQDTALSLHDKLAELGAAMIVDTVAHAERGPLLGVPQPAEGATYARKIEKSEAALDWRKPAGDLDRAIRAFNPTPGAHAVLGSTEIKIWQSHPVEGVGAPGTVLSVSADRMTVACGDQALALTELQRPGSKRLDVRSFLLGHPIAVGARFALPAA